MIRLQPPLAVIHRDVLSSPSARRRAERLLRGMTPGEVREVDDAALAALVRERWQTPPNPAATDTPDLALMAWPFAATEQEHAARLARFPELAFRRLVGDLGFVLRQDGDIARFGGAVCTTGWELHSVYGCPFRCAYCGCKGTLINVACNIEDQVAQLDRWLMRDNFQTLYKWDNVTDINPFEPEYDATRLLVEYFRSKPEKYLLHYTGKSDNVDFMLGLDHGGKTIIQWSVAPTTQSRRIEVGTAPMEARIEAARKCQEAGYLIRFRLSPIIPVKGWRDEYAGLIRLIFAKTRPDVISLCFFGWMDFDSMTRCLDTSLLDPWALDMADQRRDEVKDRKYGPFPHEVRRTVHRFLVDAIRRESPTTPVSLCIESEAMWSEFRDELGRMGDGFLCNCGPVCSPGTAFYESRRAFFAARSPQGPRSADAPQPGTHASRPRS